MKFGAFILQYLFVQTPLYNIARNTFYTNNPTEINFRHMKNNYRYVKNNCILLIISYHTLKISVE